ncbi:MAG: dihydrolipoyllysine-residue acetyltransferase [Gammaproteobacteria bacterium]
MTDIKLVTVPDIGDFSAVDVIEITVSVGDTIAKDDSMVTLETDKATMEIPAPFGGLVKELKVKKGDKVSKGSEILLLEVSEEGATTVAEQIPDTPAAEALSPSPSEPPVHVPEFRMEISNGPANHSNSTPLKDVHAGPATRRLARELGVDLSKIKGQGPKGRIQTPDLKAYVKQAMLQGGGASRDAGFNFPKMPEIDFSQFGEIKAEPLNRIKKKSGAYLHRNWVSIPHVTQFDQSDVTDLEKFRVDNKSSAEALGIRLTPLAFLLKAIVCALKAFPQFNASLSSDGETLILKNYYHIGVAVDTPLGLVVPVLRDVDKKGVFQLARELDEISVRARDGKLSSQDMQGSSFTISSLGGIGGTGFTPIINAPDVAILGVSKAEIRPIYINGEFLPRRILPFSLSYDHRVIDGAEAARFTLFFAKQLQDIRNMLL